MLDSSFRNILLMFLKPFPTSLLFHGDSEQIPHIAAAVWEKAEPKAPFSITWGLLFSAEDLRILLVVQKKKRCQGRWPGEELRVCFLSCRKPMNALINLQNFKLIYSFF